MTTLLRFVCLTLLGAVASKADVIPLNFWHNPTFETGENLDASTGTPTNWNRGGSNPSLCEVSTNNSVSPTHSLAVIDTDGNGYAEWYSDIDLASHASGGDEIDIQWSEIFFTSGDFRVSLLFFGTNDNIIGQFHFVVNGQSEGFTGDFITSPFVTRNERVPVSAGAARMRLSLVSGGALSATGTMLIDDLSVAKVPPQLPDLLVGNFHPNPEFEEGENLNDPTGTPSGWNRGGNDPTICQISSAGAISPTHSLAVVDQSAGGYGEWYSDQLLPCPARGGRLLNLQWFELHDISTGEMRVTVLFFSSSNAVAGENHYVVRGQSAGWNGNLGTSPFVRRNEQLAVPADAQTLRVSLVSGGPAETAGIMLIDNFSVAVEATAPTILFGNIWANPGFETGDNLDNPLEGVPAGWNRGGSDTSIDVLTTTNYTSSTHALAVIDNNVAGSGEWYANLDLIGRTTNGEPLSLQWFEVYNVSPEGEMRLSVLFFDSASTLLAQHHYVAAGQSAGWIGDLPCSTFTRRNEQVVVPENAARMQVSLVSGNALPTTGVMAIDDFSVAKPAAPPMLLAYNFWLNPTFEEGVQLDNPGVGLPAGGWSRGGSDSRVCRVAGDKASSPTHALALMDTNENGYGEWYADLLLEGHAEPGNQLELQWFEVYDTSGTMRVSMLFFDASGAILVEQHHTVSGQSEGWTGELASSPFVKHNEVITVPEGGVRIRLSLVSGGALNVTGTMILDDVSVQADRVRILSVLREAGGLRLAWTSKSDRSYSVEKTIDLGPEAFWSSVASGITGEGDATSYLDDAVGNPTAFYRVRQE